MNDRIKELAEQAGIFKPNEFHQHIDALQLDKFAELIVRECISIGSAKSKELFSYSKEPGDIFEHKSHAAEDVVESIKEHFGIEELDNA